MNFESGKVIANTISDPTGVDIGFSYMKIQIIRLAWSHLMSITKQVTMHGKE